jgi:hypothetical protein
MLCDSSQIVLHDKLVDCMLILPHSTSYLTYLATVVAPLSPPFAAPSSDQSHKLLKETKKLMRNY